jgi:hypothetical protein
VSALVFQFPHGAPPAVEPDGPTMSEAEIVALSGGYVQPARQLKELHERGFVRARKSALTGRVVLERAHHDAVVRGQFGSSDAQDGPRPPAQPNREGLRAHFRQKRKK